MKTADIINDLDEMTKRLLRANENALETAAWTRSSDRVRKVTVDGREAVLIG